jgi:HEAT repeat protein
MIFHSVDEALRALEDLFVGPAVHQEAIRYLGSLDECFEVEGLVKALQSDDPGVRWEAASLLALKDPKRVGDPRLRESVSHMIHTIDDPELCHELAPLLDALKGPLADMNTMREAHRVLEKFDPSACDEEEG